MNGTNGIALEGNRRRKTAALAAATWLIGLSGAAGLAEPASALVVHEWGTFTTLSSSAGKGLSGLYVDASRLPGFVYGLPYFNYDPANGWASLDKLRNVTVKMETPVLYFYADHETPVDVKVDFKGGTISQWYPTCYVCEADPASPYVDFAAQPYPGHIEWKATVLAPTANLPYTTDPLLETGEWTAPRFTGANQLRGQNGEIEKFLFYRGLGNFASAVSMRFLEDGTLSLTNGGKEDIAYLMVYDRALDAFMPEASVWFQGPLKAGQEIRVLRSKTSPLYQAGMSAMEDFRKQLVTAGLTGPESNALLNTWYNGYFIEGGLKAFWILPRAQVDAILPLQVTPGPDSLVRVIVGRTEILSPEFERDLYLARDKDSVEAKYGKDKYYMAYRDFLSKGKDWHVEASTAAIRSGLGEPGGDRHAGGTRNQGLGRAAGSRPWIWTAPLPGAAGASEAADLLGRSIPLRFFPLP